MPHERLSGALIQHWSPSNGVGRRSAGLASLRPADSLRCRACPPSARAAQDCPRLLTHSRSTPSARISSGRPETIELVDGHLDGQECVSRTPIDSDHPDSDTPHAPTEVPPARVTGGGADGICRCDDEPAQAHRRVGLRLSDPSGRRAGRDRQGPRRAGVVLHRAGRVAGCLGRLRPGWDRRPGRRRPGDSGADAGLVRPWSAPAGRARLQQLDGPT